MTVRAIQAFVEEQYGVKMPPELMSAVSDGVLWEVEESQKRRRSKGPRRLYPIVILDTLRVKIRVDFALV